MFKCAGKELVVDLQALWSVTYLILLGAGALISGLCLAWAGIQYYGFYWWGLLIGVCLGSRLALNRIEL